MLHRCLISGSDRESVEGVGTFALAELLRRKLVMIVLSKEKIEPFFEFIRERDELLVRRAVFDGQLSVKTPEEVYLTDGEFRPSEMIGKILATMKLALSQGFSGFAGAGEITVLGSSEEERSELFYYENEINRTFSDFPAISLLCLYDTRSFSSEDIEQVLLLHS